MENLLYVYGIFGAVTALYILRKPSRKLDPVGVLSQCFLSIICGVLWPVTWVMLIAVELTD